jgi:hypothetical protein
MTNKLREADKRIEVLKISADERINLAIDNKARKRTWNHSKLKHRVRTV